MGNHLRKCWLARIFFCLTLHQAVMLALASLPSTSTSIKASSNAKSFNAKSRNNQLMPPVEDMSSHASCLYCTFPPHCGLESLEVNCSTSALCRKKRLVTREATCKYCWQLDEVFHSCQEVTGCQINDVNLVRSICRVDDTVICRGSRVFYKNVRCKWTSGYSWIRTLLLSITLGGFGFDRFYLGLWKSGVGKLFSFGGLGIWTIADIVLIASGYLQPADGSLYI